MTDRELIEHWRGHYDRVAKELSDATFKIGKLERQVDDLKKTSFSTVDYYGQIDFNSGFGWFEHKEHGEESCGQFKFRKETTKFNHDHYSIYDYDNCYEINKQVMSALMQHTEGFNGLYTGA